MPDSSRVNIEVEESHAGTRADVFLSVWLSRMLGFDVSREEAKRLLNAGLVEQNEKTLKPKSKVRAGTLLIHCDEASLVEAVRPLAVLLRATPASIPLDLLFEDERLAVINKPAGMSVHPSPTDPDPTIAEALMHRWRIGAVEPDDSGERDPVEALKSALLSENVGIVHRLDKMTSGCLLVARDRPAHAFLSSQFKAREVEKEYLALVLGTPREKSGAIDQPIERHPRDRTRYIASDKGRPASTEWRVIGSSSGLTLLEIRIHTGRTHQIRVHLKSIGLEILGDSLYGTAENARFLKSAESGGAGRHAGTKILDALGWDGEKCTAGQMLHARRLAFRHPDERPVEFEAALPGSFQAVVDLLDL